MNRCNLFLFLGLAAFGPVLSSCSGPGPAAERPASVQRAVADRPNVIVILSDDQGWADIGYNNPRVYTPTLDKLAREGAMLKSQYVMPQCTPTRVALMTGRYPSRFGLQARHANNEQVIPLDTPTLSRMFDAMGYDTFMTGKWHLGSLPEFGPNRFGFHGSHGSLTGAVGMYDHRYHAKPDMPYDPTWHENLSIIPGFENGTHVTDLCGGRAVEFIRQKRTQPFFLYVPFHAPHLPLDERGPFTDVPTQPDPANPKRWLNEDTNPWFNDPAGTIQAEPERDKRLLLAAVYHMDHAIGDIVQALEETGQRDNTVIFFSSDNGPWVTNPTGGGYPDNIPLINYSQPDELRGRKLDVYEGGIHVAGFVNWPGRISPKEVQPYVHIVDWFPTMAGLIGYRPPRAIPWDGVDIGNLLFDENALPPDRDLYWIWNPQSDRWAVRYGDWKIVKYAKQEPSTPDDWQLFNLADDPKEETNVAAANPDIVKQMHARFLRHRRLDYDGELIHSSWDGNLPDRR